MGERLPKKTVSFKDGYKVRQLRLLFEDEDDPLIMRNNERKNTASLLETCNSRFLSFEKQTTPSTANVKIAHVR